jgi:ubiquinone/menaquinone biosynthesis C-methylase UbiE
VSGNMKRGSFARPEVAAAYASAQLFAAGEDLELLRQTAALTERERVLDLGTAAGHTALALAPDAASVLGVDPAPAMLHQARRLVAERQLANVAFVVASADPLPCPDAAFDVVTCRLAAHHFPDLPGALYEIARVLRPGGRLLVVDTIAPEDEALDAFINEVEVTRDPSHQHSYRLSEWARALAGFGMNMTTVAQWYLPLEFTAWVARVGTAPAGIAHLEILFDRATSAAVAEFAITPSPARSFRLPAALFVGELS